MTKSEEVGLLNTNDLSYCLLQHGMSFCQLSSNVMVSLAEGEGEKGARLINNLIDPVQ